MIAETRSAVRRMVRRRGFSFVFVSILGISLGITLTVATLA